VLLATMVIGSIVAALSHSLVPLLIGRLLQGISGGSVSLGISILRDVLPPERLARAIALVSATLGVGGALGLPLSAIVSQYLDWHSIFWMSGLLGALAFFATLTIVPPSVLRALGRFDGLGAIGLAVGLCGILLGITRGSLWGWTSPLTLGFGLGGIGILLLWAWFEWRHPSPLVNLRVSSRRPVLFTNLSSVAMGFAMFGTNIALPRLLGQEEGPDGVGLGLSLTQSSLVLMLGGLVMMVVSPIAGRMIDRHGARPFLIGGAVIIVGTYGAFLLMLTEHNPWLLALVNAINGIGIGIGFAAMPTLIMQAVPPTETAAANGLNTLMRTIGTTSAAALMGMVFAHSIVTVDGMELITLEGFRMAFFMGAVCGVVGAILAACIPRHHESYGRTAIAEE